jgi:hypothetical protein
MDIYPPELVTHEAPLLVISGLGGPKNYSESPTYPLIDNGPHVSSHAPPATDETAERLAEYFLKRDATGLWGVRQEKSSRSAHLPVFRIRLVGRVCGLAWRRWGLKVSHLESELTGLGILGLLPSSSKSKPSVLFWWSSCSGIAFASISTVPRLPAVSRWSDIPSLAEKASINITSGVCFVLFAVYRDK